MKAFTKILGASIAALILLLFALLLIVWERPPELARIGANLRTRLEAVYLLVQGPENKIEPVSGPEALHAFLRNVLFFAHDQELVEKVFQSAIDFVSQVPVYRLTFVPDIKVWELIG